MTAYIYFVAIEIEAVKSHQLLLLMLLSVLFDYHRALPLAPQPAMLVTDQRLLHFP